MGIPPPPGPQPSGRLELDLDESTSTLLAHEDGSCEWLDSSDYRVAEESNPSCDQTWDGAL